MYKGGFKMGGGNMQNLMKQAQIMQEQLVRQQEEAEKKLSNTEITSTSGGGMVEIKMSGKRRITSIVINPQVVDADDVEMLEDLILACTNDALEQIDKLEEELKPNNIGGLF